MAIETKTASFECPCCNGRIESQPGATTARCPHCRQTVPAPSPADSEAKAKKALAALDKAHAAALAGRPGILSALAGPEMICPHCGSRGRPRTAYRGSGVVTLVLFVLAIVVGIPAWFMLGIIFSVPVFLALFLPTLAYSFWRLTTRHKACRSCRQPGTIPLDSPIGRKLLQDLREKR